VTNKLGPSEDIPAASKCAAIRLVFIDPVNPKTAVEKYEPFDTPTTWATQGERPITELLFTPFVLIAI